MVTDVNSAVGSINAISSKNDAAKSVVAREGLGIAETFDSFLKLLTTQLRNQDPTEPLDANQFTQQLVEFAGVEQSVKSNTNLEKLIEVTKQSQTSNGLFAGTSFIGKYVEAAGNKASLSNGISSFTYTLSDQAGSTLIRILDENDNLVFSTTGETDEGKHTFVWNGRDSNDVKQKDGTYTIEVTALDTTNNVLPVSTTVNGLVSSVISGNGGVELQIGDAKIPLELINAVHDKNPNAVEETTTEETATEGG